MGRVLSPILLPLSGSNWKGPSSLSTLPSDYCDSCAIFKKDIQAKQQVINRLRQSSGAADDIQQAECEKGEIESE